MGRVLISSGVLLNTWGMGVVGTWPGGVRMGDWELTLTAQAGPVMEQQVPSLRTLQKLNTW